MINDYLEQQVKTITKLRESSDTIQKIFDVILDAREGEKGIYVMGNGGSASTATHFVSDLLKTSITKDKKRFKAVSLSDNIPVILAWSNDKSYLNCVAHGFRDAESWEKLGDIILQCGKQNTYFEGIEPRILYDEDAMKKLQKQCENIN